jgi:hypothetical protein
LPLSGFEHWKLAIAYNEISSMEQSKVELAEAARAFFEDGSGAKAPVARAFFELSTLMEAFRNVQEARSFKGDSNFEASLVKFAKASEILRATVHYAYLASYVSGCASLETAGQMESDEDKFTGYKNSIALFEQSKLALSFRDERHPSLRSIDVLIKLAISRALLVESHIFTSDGSSAESRKKKEQSKKVAEDFLVLLREQKIEPARYKIDYFLKYDCERALKGAVLSTFPEATSLWIGNLGGNPAHLESLGSQTIDKTIGAFQSIIWPMRSNFRGKLRISYLDETSEKRFDEGCLTII